jgi:hypothetical protein
MRLALFILLTLLTMLAGCGGNGEPSPKSTPATAETPAAPQEMTPGTAGVNIDAIILTADDLPDGWQFQGIDECGGSGPRASLCPAQGILQGKVFFATRGVGENLSAVVVVADPGQAETVAEAVVSRALTGERPWTQETVDEPVVGTVKLEQELTDVSPVRVVQRLVFHRDPVVVDISLSMYAESQDISIDQLAGLIEERIARQSP